MKLLAQCCLLLHSCFIPGTQTLPEILRFYCQGNNQSSTSELLLVSNSGYPPWPALPHVPVARASWVLWLLFCVSRTT